MRQSCKLAALSLFRSKRESLRWMHPLFLFVRYFVKAQLNEQPHHASRSPAQLAAALSDTACIFVGEQIIGSFYEPFCHSK